MKLRDLATVSDDDLHALIAEAANDRALDAALEEIDRRQACEAELDRLLDEGVTWRDAYAQAYDIDIAEIERMERFAFIDAHRLPGETAQQVSDRLHRDYVDLHHDAAEAATRGHMLSRVGRDVGIHPITLFTGSAARVRKYASSELRRFFTENGRITRVEYRALIIGRPSDIAKAAQVDHNYGDVVAG